MWIVVIIIIVFSWLLRYFFKDVEKPHCIPDQYETLEEVNQALREAGLESCNLILGIDFTASNKTQGKNGTNLHSLPSNPYTQVIEICGKTLHNLDDDNWIPTFGFGCKQTKGKACFSFTKEERGCFGFEGVLEAYDRIVPYIELSGPTNFAPVINQAIDIVQETKEFHVLIIICDGQVTNKEQTRDAIVKACKYPLAIIIVGVGMGPWDDMEMYDDNIKGRDWDNVQFVPFNKLKGPFVVAALQELPEQFKLLRKRGMI